MFGDLLRQLLDLCNVKMYVLAQELGYDKSYLSKWINNSDCKILLDQRKYVNKFDEIQGLLGLTDKERAQILSINLSNAPGRKYKEVWIGLGGAQSAVYATEVSPEEYYCYTTEETEKLELQRLTEKLGGNIELAIKQLAESKRSK